MNNTYNNGKNEWYEDKIKWITMVKILPEIWPSHRISNKNKGIKSQTINIHTVYNINIYILPYTPTPTKKRITKLRNKKTQIQFSICQREDKNKYIHTHTQDTYKRGGYTSLHIYIERKKEIYIKLV